MVNKLGLSAWAVALAAVWYIGHLRHDTAKHITQVISQNPTTLSEIESGAFQTRLNEWLSSDNFTVSWTQEQSEWDTLNGRKTPGNYTVERKIIWPVGTWWIHIPMNDQSQ